MFREVLDDKMTFEQTPGIVGGAFWEEEGFWQGGWGGEAQIRTRFQGANALHRVSEGNSSSKCNGDIRQGDRQRRQKGGSQISVTRTSVAIELLP